ncbi:MAG: hypothetical protein U1D55_12410 [Phycisphaerae bacterium]
MGRATRISIGVITAAWVLTLLGGCPNTATAIYDVAPGTYWVDRSQDGEVIYYQLPTARGTDGAWFTLGIDAPWFDGPAFYSFDGAAWTREPAAAGLTLDQAVQLNDATPPIP